MHRLRSKALVVAALALGSGCANLDPTLRNSVTLRYQHVANAHQVRFANALALSPPYAPVQFVTPLEAPGFWAIFVLCSLRVGGALPGFDYDVDKFRVEYDGQTFGPLQPQALRHEASADLNTAADTPAIATAIAEEIQVGPARQALPPGNYPALNYRIAVYVPRELPGYTNDQLTLRYVGQPSLVLGNGRSPADLAVAGGSAGGAVAGACQP